MKVKTIIKNVANRIKAEFNYIHTHEWASWLFVVLGAFLISFLSYLIFNGNNGNPSVNLYQPNNVSKVNDIANQGRAFVNSLDYTVLYIVGWILFFILIGIGVYLLARRKMKWRYAFLLVFAISVVARLTYMNSTDNIFTRQYDVWSSSYYGHYSITMHIYENGFKLPELSMRGISDASDLAKRLENSYQMYHPKFAHYMYAIVMHINNLIFHTDRADFELYESVRIFTCGLMIINVYVSYLIFKEILKTNLSIFIATCIIAFAPSLIRMSAGSNNDPMLYFFMFLAVLFAIRFYKRNGWLNIILCAFSIGLAMGSKLSGALIAIPIGSLFVYKFVRLFFDYKGKELRNALLKLLLYYAVFIVICAPIGLFWPLYNYKNYNQPLSYVWHNLNKLLLINDPATREGVEVYSYPSMYMFFSFRAFFNSMFHVGFYNANTAKMVDFNMYTNAFKTSIFGEYSYGPNIIYMCVFLYASAFIYLFGAMGIGMYYIIKGLIKKNFDWPVLLSFPILIYYAYVLFKAKEGWGYVLMVPCVIGIIFDIIYIVKNYQRMHNNHLVILFFIILFETFTISFFDFQVQYPYTCTSDFRYIIILLLPCGYVMGRLFEKQKDNKVFLYPAIAVLIVYFFFSVGLNMCI